MLHASNVTKTERVAVAKSGIAPRVAPARGSRGTGVAGANNVTVSQCALGVWDISNYDFTVNPPDGDKIGDAPTARGTY